MNMWWKFLIGRLMLGGFCCGKWATGGGSSHSHARRYPIPLPSLSAGKFQPTASGQKAVTLHLTERGKAHRGSVNHLAFYEVATMPSKLDTFQIGWMSNGITIPIAARVDATT